MGTGQRRPSRSPRSQRSRSADVDCLKKYTERRVEERRHTEVTDTSKLDPSRWIPLSKSIPRVQPPSKKSPQPSRDEEKRSRSVAEITEETTSDTSKSTANASKKQSPTKEGETKDDGEKSTSLSPSVQRQSAGRSLSTDVGRVKNEKRAEERRHTECSDPRTIATRWIPQINTSRFRYDASPFARISSSCEITKNAATRWMTFTKNPSPCPIPRMNPDRKSSTVDLPTKDQDPSVKPTKKETPKWEPHRKFSPVSSKANRDDNKSQDDADPDQERSSTKKSPDSNDRSSRLSQRMRDLYDFKTENEWPKRANPRRENTWISKSSSEEERNSHSTRRNSQDLEFNERMLRIKNYLQLKDTKVRTDHEAIEKLTKGTFEKNSEISDETKRPKRLKDKQGHSEDLGIAKPRIKERRTYSDDYEEKARRASRLTRSDEVTERHPSKDMKENTRNVDVKSQESRGNHSEAETSKKNPRGSGGSHPSISNYCTKRGSVECKSTRPLYEIPPRRAFSQNEERPATPVPPIEWNDDRYVVRKLSSERQKRDSTRYKVYLT